MAKKYRVWLYGSSMTASYDGYVDILADNDRDAEARALTKLTSKNGSFADWSKSMFRIVKIEKLR